MKNQTNLPLVLLGKYLGRPLAWILRKQNSFLINKGFSPKLAKWLAITTNLLVFIVILIMLFPMWIVLSTIIIIGLLAAGIDLPEPPPSAEWRMGPSGWGLYRGDECIIWSDDPNDQNE